MNTRDIELPPLPSPFGIVDPMGSGEKIYTLKDMGDYARAYARAAIEADRIKRDDYINDDRDQLRAEIVALKGTIADLEANRQRRGEPVHLFRRRGQPSGDFVTCSLERYAELSAMQDKFDTMIAYTAPQPAEPTDKNFLSVAVPVKVQSDDVLDAALSNLEHDNYEQSYSGYKNRQADIALIRAILARYSHLAATTHKSSNQNRLIEDLKLVYGDNKPIATVITHNNHKLLSFDPGALDELPEGTILYAKK